MQRDHEFATRNSKLATGSSGGDRDNSNTEVSSFPTAMIPPHHASELKAIQRSFSDADIEALTPNSMSPPRSGPSSRIGTPLADIPPSPNAQSRYHSFPPLGSPIVTSSVQHPQSFSSIQRSSSDVVEQSLSLSDGALTVPGSDAKPSPAQTSPNLYVDVATPTASVPGDIVSEVSTPALTTSIFSSPTVSPTISSISSPQVPGVGMISPMLQSELNAVSPLNPHDMGSPYANPLSYSLVLDK